MRRQGISPLAILLLVAAALFLGACKQSPPAPEQKAGALQATSPPPVYQASWDVTAWYVDPAASVTGASDTNDCQTALTPCKTWAGVVAKLGTYSPRLRHNTTFTFLSSHTDGSDPVVFKPQIENGAYANILCSLPAAAQTGTLAGVVAKATTQGAPQLLNATLGAGASAGQMIVNTTHPSRAWVYKNVAGNTWSITQPLAPVVLPVYPNSGTEVNTWANGDAFSVYSPIKVLFADVRPINTSYDTATYSNLLQVNGCSFFDPGAVGQTNVHFGNDVTVSESVALTASVLFDAGAPVNGTGAVNSWLPSVTASAAPYYVYGYEYSFLKFSGGYLSYIIGNSASFTNGVIIDYPHPMGLMGGNLSDVYLGTGTVLSALGPVQIYGPVWGPGTMDAKGGTFFYPSGAGAAAANLRVAVTNLQGQNKACLAVPSSASAFATCNLALTATQLDTSLGATAGCLTTGASAFCNYGP